MTRLAARRPLAGLLLTALVSALVLAAAAPAAKPKKGARFTGSTSVTPIEGFRAPVRFRVSPSGNALYNFTFGSLGCFGAGGFRPGVNPYTGGSLINAGRVKVAAHGRVSAKALSSSSVSHETTTTTIRITARFSSAKKMGGTITFSQVATGGGVNSKCGPASISFSASAH